MALVTRRPQYPLWEPVAELEMFPGNMRRFLEGLEPFPALKERMGWMPTVDVSESDEELIITAELPGMEKKDITVRVENAVLTLTGEKKGTKEETDEKRRYHLFERFYGSFTRAFALPRAVVAEKVTATFENGVLTIRLPKMTEAKGRVVEVLAK